jgi:K+-transporting ATPase KdpF subunit
MWPRAIGSSEVTVVLDYGISLLVSVALLVYLTVALLKPEKF